MYGDGSTARDYTYIDDIVHGLSDCINYIQTNDNVCETINIGNKSPVSLKDMISTIEELAAKKFLIEKIPVQPGDVQITFADIEKAKQLFNYRPETAFRDGIRKFLTWFNTNVAN